MLFLQMVKFSSPDWTGMVHMTLNTLFILLNKSYTTVMYEIVSYLLPVFFMINAWTREC